MEKKKFPEHDEIVLCNVEKILGTTVFARILNYGKEGVIATSEVAPGRIRNIRDYVNVGKKLVCKVLRVDERTGHIDLSLRRVSKKEKEEILAKEGKERDVIAMLKIVVKEKADSVIEKARKEYPTLLEFFQDIDKVNAESFGLAKAEQEQLVKIAREKPKKTVSVSTDIKMRSEESDGIIKIKSIFEDVLKMNKNAKVTYLSASNYAILITAQDYKEANRKMQEILKKIGQDAKDKGCKAEIPE